MSTPFHLRPLAEQLEAMRSLPEQRQEKERQKRMRTLESFSLEAVEAVEQDAMPYRCQTCKDMHFVHDEERWQVSGFHDLALVPCPDCGQQYQRERLRALSGLSAEMQNWTLEHFQKQHGRIEALAAAQKAVEKPRGFLTFWGAWGTGKSYLLAAIVNECKGKGLPSVYTTVADLLDDLRETFNPKAELSFSRLFERVQNCKVLAIDELEKFHTTPWSEEKFFQLVDHRYRNASGCLTVLATNRPVRHGTSIIQNTAYSGYLESRLLEKRFSVVEVKGGDMRPQAGW